MTVLLLQRKQIMKLQQEPIKSIMFIINRKELLFGVKLIWNILISLRIFFKERPDIVNTTGVFGNASNLQDCQIL